eukprot:gene10002-12267_t
MGNTVGAPIVSEYLEDEIGPIVSQHSLGNGRFLKTLKAVHDQEGYVVVKIYKKRNTKESLEKYRVMLREIKENFVITPSLNIMPYQNFLETERSGYLIRQYFHNNLYDRLSTRPFLSMIEKKFIAYQLLQALSQIFFKGVSHGDIKCENIMVTTANWVYLSDFACYKPTYIPEDNPADFSYYFDTSGRRTCYIAPERFYETNKGVPQGDLTNQMDIFSLGCVIAELFLEGFPIFDFSQLLSYRKGEYNPEPVIRRIPDIHIQSLILHMIQKEPDARFTPEKYLNLWADKAFPSYFSFIHNLMPCLMKMENDDKIISGVSSPNLQQQQQSSPILTSQQSQPPIKKSSLSNSNSNNNLANSNEIVIKNISNNIIKTENFIKDFETFEKIDINNLKKEDFKNVSSDLLENLEQQSKLPSSNSTSTTVDTVTTTTTTITTATTTTNTEIQPTIIEGLDLFLSILYSALKHCQFPQCKVKCVGSLLIKFATYLDDECRLQKIVPYIMSMTAPEQPTLVRVEALRSLAKVLEMVQSFPPSESQIFSQYILPSLSQLTSESTEELVRISFAEILPQLATTAKRFLEIAQHYRDPGTEGLMERKDRIKYRVYDYELQEIQDLFFNKVSDLLTKDPCNTLKRIILSDIYRLCVFFGRQKTNESVLPLIITFLNDKDWQLRCAFFENIVAVCTVVGAGSLESFIYPCIILALTDEEEFVTEKALSSLAELCSLGLLRKAILLELLLKTSPLLLHPNTWIRYRVISLITKICGSLSKTDIYCYVKPKLAPFLVAEISDNITESILLQLLLPPISRESFNRIVKFMYKNTVSINSSLGAGGQSDDVQTRESSGGSYRRLRALSKKLFIPPDGSSNGAYNNQYSSGSGDEFIFMKQMKNLFIPEDDQIKILKAFDYLQAKRFKEDDKSYTPSTNVNKLVLSSPLDITKLPTPSTPVRLVKLRNQNEMTLSTLSLNSPPPTGSINSGGAANPNLTSNTPNASNSTSSSAAITTSSSSTLSSSNTTSAKNDILTHQNELNIVNKKYYLNYNDPNTFSLNSVLSFDTTTTCYIKAPPALPDLGMTDQSSHLPSGSTTGAQMMGTNANSPIGGGMGGSGAMDNIMSPLSSWKPTGILVSHFFEHRGAVNEIQVSRDNLFFATASNDGTVKIWDCQRMEKSVTNRARQTYNQQEGRITSISICEKSHAVASASDKGSIHIFKVGIGGRQKNGNLKYTGLSTVKVISESEGNIVSVDHYSTNSASIVTYATSKGGIHGWDLRSQQEAFQLVNESSLGLIQSFLIDPQRNWLVTGTSRGFLTCWDLRFMIPLYSHRVTNGRIFKLAPYLGPKSSESWIFLSTDSKENVTVFDLYSKTTKKIFMRTFNLDDNQQQQILNQPPVQQPNSTTPPPTSTTTTTSTSSILNQNINNSNYDFGIDNMRPVPSNTNLNSLSMKSTSSSMVFSTNNLPFFNQQQQQLLQQPQDRPLSSSLSQPSTQQQQERKTPPVRALLSPPNCSYIITAGDDKRIKYWDWDNPSQSYYISPGKESPPPFIHKFNPNTQTGTEIHEEVWYDNSNSFFTNTLQQQPTSSLSSSTSLGSSSGSGIGSGSGKQKQKGGMSMPTIHHQESILDLKIMEVPNPMLISASTDGVVKVWK